MVEYVPSTYTRLIIPMILPIWAKCLKLFEDNDDIQEVFHNWENEDDYEG